MTAGAAHRQWTLGSHLLVSLPQGRMHLSKADMLVSVPADFSFSSKLFVVITFDGPPEAGGLAVH